MLGKLIKCEQFTPQNNGTISESITQGWTPQAIECWQVGGKCACCSVGRANYSFECQMPKVIKTLLSTVGEPKEEDLPTSMTRESA